MESLVCESQLEEEETPTGWIDPRFWRVVWSRPLPSRPERDRVNPCSPRYAKGRPGGTAGPSLYVLVACPENRVIGSGAY